MTSRGNGGCMPDLDAVFAELKSVMAPYAARLHTQQDDDSVLYVDTTGAYFVIGPMIETASGRNLTEETVSALSVLSSEDMKKVDALVAISVGTKGPKVYFITDPL